MLQGRQTSVLSFVNISVSIILGIGIGLLLGDALAVFFAKVYIWDTSKVLLMQIKFDSMGKDHLETSENVINEWIEAIKSDIR